MTNAVDSLNVENNVERSRCATALASHAGIPEPLVPRFEEGGGCLRPDGSLWRKEYQGEAVQNQRSTRAEAPSLPNARGLASSTSTEPRFCPRGPVGTILRSSGFSAALVGGSWGLVSASLDTYRGVLWPADGSSLLRSNLDVGRRRKQMRRVVIGGLEDFKVGSGSTVDDQYCIGVLTIRAGGFFRRVISE